MKKLFIALALSTGLASCLDMSSNENTTGGLKPKYVKYIETGDGCRYTFSYNTMNSISNISYMDFADPSNRKSYDIDYNTSTIDIESGSELWRMRLNGYASLDKYYKATSTGEELLSSFSYSTPYSNVAQLSGISSDNNRSNASITWISIYAIGMSRNTVIKEENGEDVTYSTTVKYTYDAYVSNIHAYFNFFYFLVPELLEVSKLDNTVASAISIIGYPCYYLPTKVTVERTKVTVDGTTPIETVERNYSYDCDDNGYVNAIYSGSGDNKELLYSIEYYASSSGSTETGTQE